MNKKLVLIQNGSKPGAPAGDQIQDTCPQCDAPLTIAEVSFTWTGTDLVWGPCPSCAPVDNGEAKPSEASAAA